MKNVITWEYTRGSAMIMIIMIISRSKVQQSWH